MRRKFRKYTKRHLDGYHKQNKNYLYLIIGILFLLLIYFVFFDSDPITNLYEDTKETISEGLSKIQAVNFSSSSNSVNKVRLVPSEMEEYGVWKTLHKSCAQVETAGESQGIYDMKKKVCREACGKRDMEYSSNDCEKDLLVCYCKL